MIETLTNSQGKQKTLYIMVIAMILLCGCSGNSTKTALPATNEQKSDCLRQAEDSASHQLTSTKATETIVPTIFDALAKDMVYVDNDTGGFYICKYEVTQKLWKEVMGDNPSEMQGDDLPVEQVNWNDCQAFIAKLNELTGKFRHALEHQQKRKNYRLPTEAEWEYACKGGKYSKGYKYSGSDDIDKVAWYDANSEGKTHPVGKKQPNELGLYDMSGNVWEWCQDMQDGTGMCRGGSWIHNARNCDPSLPNETPRAFYINSLGLRLAQ